MAGDRAQLLERMLRGPDPQLVSAVGWHNEVGWSLAPRTVVDDFLLVPLAGRLEALVDDRRWRLVPGHALLLPAGRLHALRNTGGRACRHVVVHAVLLDADRRSWWAHWREPVLRLPGECHDWSQRLAMIVANAAAHPVLATALTQALLIDLTAGLLQGGAALRSHPPLEQRVATVLQRMQSDYAQDLSIDEYAAAVGLSAVQLRALFRRHLHTSPKGWLTGWRLQQAARMLRHGNESVQAIASAVGYASDHYFHRCFKQAYGVTPSEYRRGAGPV